MTDRQGSPAAARRKRATPGSRAVGREDTLAHVVQTVHRIFKVVDTFSRQALREFGVSGPQIWALRTIDASSGITIGNLAGKMYLHISTVSGILDRLEERGLVERQRSTEDRRVTLLQVTARGRAVLARAPEPPRSLILRGLRTLPAAELRRLRQSLDTLARIMQVPREVAED
ncbi:MAG TPA: MarR family transcriptional regulator [Planctomycetota bacterium]|nr:MarR family transcriptional regulator [Planctomycetota bacterium]